MNVEYYAQRLLNPFRGCIQVIRHQAAEAVSMDGVHWDIYVSNDTLLDGLEDGAAGRIQVSDIRYGSWSAGQGLRRGPLYPSADFYRMERMGAVLHEQLPRLHGRLPFPFRDCHELWLVDHAGMPLALLHSVLREADTAEPGPAAWHIGHAALESGFATTGAPSGDPGHALMEYINGLAAGSAWFLRDADGGGRRLDGRGVPLPGPAFPPLLLATAGHDAAHGRLVADYLAWLSPWLLLLPHLDRETRRVLERQARGRAEEMERQHPLYPDTVDPDQLRAARVEAMLRRAGADQLDGTAADLSTFYIELSPGGAE